MKPFYGEVYGVKRNDTIIVCNGFIVHSVVNSDYINTRRCAPRHPVEGNQCAMIIFNAIYCIVIIVFIAIIIYAYKKYKQPVIELVDIIKTIYSILTRFQSNNEDSIAKLTKSVDVLAKINSNLCNKVSNIKAIVSKRNKTNNASSKSKAKISSNLSGKGINSQSSK